MLVELDRDGKDVFGILYVSLVSGPPVQDRMGLKAYISLVGKFDSISEEITTINAAGKETKERVLVRGNQKLDLNEEEVTFLSNSLDDLLLRCPREWLIWLQKAYELLGIDPIKE